VVLIDLWLRNSGKATSYKKSVILQCSQLHQILLYPSFMKATPLCSFFSIFQKTTYLCTKQVQTRSKSLENISSISLYNSTGPLYTNFTKHHTIKYTYPVHCQYSRSHLHKCHTFYQWPVDYTRIVLTSHHRSTLRLS
jgi:hypothetical protein